MNRFQSKSVNSITHFFIYALTFLLIWEWLRPIPVITATGQIEVFVWFTLFSAVLIYLRIPAYVTAPAVFIAILFCLHIIFFEGSFLSLAGGGATLQTFLQEFTVNMGLILSGNFAALTDLFRTFLLFMLLALISYLLYFWVLYTRKVFFFLFCTVVYVAVLDTFTLVDASQAIVRIVVIGFFMITLLQMLKVQDEERAIGRNRTNFISPAWMYTLITIVSLAVIAGFIAPKPEAQWNDPVPAIERFAGVEGLTGGSSGVQRVGYGVNDERLGGGFVQDDGPVFEAVTDRETYWRGESKDEYTGSGWVSSPEYMEADADTAENIRMFQEGAEAEQAEVSIEMAEEAEFELIFYPGQLQEIQSASASAGGASYAESELQFMMDALGGRVQAQNTQGEEVYFDSYDLLYDDAAFPVEALREGEDEIPEAVIERYLQLPEDLPERVGDLAEEITEEYDTRYDKAVAVEQYFSENEFEYSTTDVPIPAEDEDYVDQFLFETQTGYCDNYSTSMAVMLRTLDIPTRWVKGFTAGEEIEELEDGSYVYEVANNNAHSWVEVYFSDVGWVPFEPTQGFTNYAEFEEEATEENGEDPEDPEIPDPEIPDADNTSAEDLLEEGADGETDLDGSEEDEEGSFTFFTAKNMLISIPLAWAVAALYRRQNLLQNKFFLYRYRWFGGDESFKKAYGRLLWILQKEGLPRADGETLREYAERVDMVIGSKAMMKLTLAYERIYYGGRDTGGEWEKQKKDWEEIVNTLNA